MDKKPTPTLRDLYPHLDDDELAQVEDAFERYLALVLRIFERLEAESEQPEAHLTRDDGAVACDS